MTTTDVAKAMYEADGPELAWASASDHDRYRYRKLAQAGFATFSRQLAEARAERDTYRELWEHNTAASMAALDRALTAEEALAEAQKVIERLQALIYRYRHETPLGYQPHMIAADADAILSSTAPRLRFAKPIAGAE